MLGFIGGTGPEGRGLALRLALTGEEVLIGSRDIGRAIEAAKRIATLAPSASIAGAVNSEVARRADVVFVTVPYPAQRATLEGLARFLSAKTVVDVVAPIEFSDGIARAVPVAEGSAAQQAQAILEDSTVVAAFQSISASDLLVQKRRLQSDVVVCADDGEAKARVMGLAERIEGIRPIDGGGLENARYVEDLTALLLNINRIYKVHSSIKIIGV